jgi:hypothetical protein
MDTEFYCPKKVLGDGTICSEGYPILTDLVKLGDAPRVKFVEKSLRCRAWQEACKECKTDCQYYQEDDTEDCIAKNGYCKIIERMSGGFDEW